MSRMHRFDWFSRQRTRHSGRSPLTRRLGVELLEDRRMLAVITVTSTADNTFPGGGVTLREAVQAANTDSSVDGSDAGSGADIIRFSDALAGETITLGGIDLNLTEALTIDGTTLANNVTIDANNASRIFNITTTTGDFTLAGLTLTGGRTTGDNVSSNTTFSGGAVRSLTTGNLTIDQSTVTGNSTTGFSARGGGIFSSGNVTLSSNTVTGNSTAGERADGGGIFSFGAVTLTSSTVSGNSTTGDSATGGGIFSGNVTLTSSTVNGNSTAGERADGGGILANSSITLTSSTVSGNSTAGSSADGGGIYTGGAGTVKLTSSTVTANHAYFSNARAGGISIFSDTSSTITHSIVAGNTAGGSSPDIRHDSNPFSSLNFSIIGTAVTLFFNSLANIKTNDPMLGSLTNNGGPTETHAPLPASPAIDGGSPSYDVVAIPYDQRGAPFARGAGLRVDIGAIEDQPIAASADFDTDGDIDGADFLAWQRGFGTPNANKPDGDADNDNVVDGVDLGIWESQFGLPAPVVAGGGLSAISAQPSAELIDAAMALVLDDQVAETPTYDEETSFAATDTDFVFAAEVFAPAVVFADEADQPDTDSSEGEDETPWLADELLEQVFG